MTTGSGYELEGRELEGGSCGWNGQGVRGGQEIEFGWSSGITCGLGFADEAVQCPRTQDRDPQCIRVGRCGACGWTNGYLAFTNQGRHWVYISCWRSYTFKDWSEPYVAWSVNFLRSEGLITNSSFWCSGCFSHSFPVHFSAPSNSQERRLTIGSQHRSSNRA